MWGTEVVDVCAEGRGAVPGSKVGRSSCREMPAADRMERCHPNTKLNSRQMHPSTEAETLSFQVRKTGGSQQVHAPPGPWVILAAVSYTIPPKSTK